MTPEQRIALDWPCHLGAETMKARYRQQRGRWSVVLTVNTGYE